MTWEFGNEKNLSKLLEYECGLEQLFRKLPGLCGVCQYRKDILPADVLETALYTHEAVYISETLSRMNPYYLPPDSLIHGRPIKSTGEVLDMLNDFREPMEN
jgi:hypothetical protein